MSKSRVKAFVGGAIAMGLASVSAGCATTYLPNTDVEDVGENRDIVAFCERYRKAVERKDASAILKMVSKNYYEDGGNADATDDMDYEAFRKFVTGESKQADGYSLMDATSIRHEIRYRRVTSKDERVFVDYTFSASFRIPNGHGEEWKRKVDDNRLELLKGDDGDYHIVGGM